MITKVPGSPSSPHPGPLHTPTPTHTHTHIHAHAHYLLIDDYKVRELPGYNYKKWG